MVCRRKGKAVEVVRWMARVSSGIAALLIMLIFLAKDLSVVLNIFFIFQRVKAQWFLPSLAYGRDSCLPGNGKYGQGLLQSVAW